MPLFHTNRNLQRRIDGNIPVDAYIDPGSGQVSVESQIKSSVTSFEVQILEDIDFLMSCLLINLWLIRERSQITS